MRRFDLTPLFRNSVGFDALDKMFETAMSEARETSYPPYNISKHGENDYKITMAIAGFGEKDLDITTRENVLTVRGKIPAEDADVTYLHRGIAKRAFEHTFQLADHVRVTGADLNNGLLEVLLTRELPEAAKPRKIAIGAVGKEVQLEAEAVS